MSTAAKFIAGKQFSLVLVLLTLLAESACTNQSEVAIAYFVPAYGKMKFVNQSGLVIREIEVGVSPSSCSWSPENGNIAFSDFDSLYTINPDGTGLTRITQLTGGMEELSWSSDGEWIVFDTNTAYNNTPFSGRESEIYLTDVADSKSVRLAAGMNPDWSPIGDIIVYVSMNTSGGFPHIFTLKVGETNSIQLTDGFTGNYNPRWSPDGDRIAFISTRSHPNGSNREIYLMNADGSDVIQLTNFEMKDLQAIDLEWSPTGKQIAVLATGLSIDKFLYTIGIDDSDMQLVVSETSLRCPLWLPTP